MVPVPPRPPRLPRLAVRLALLAAAAWWCPWGAAAQDAPTDSLVLRGDVVADTLANGLAYYILPNARPVERAELRLVVKAGSILEDDDQRGLAHFVEHMAFNGTEHYAENDLVDYIQSTGAAFGADLNAYTSFDETVYKLQVRTDSAEVLREGLNILRDWAGGITFDSVEIDKERGVVLSEWRSGLGAQERLRDQTLPVLFAGSRYAERLPIGDTAVLARAPHETLRRFYREWYRPSLMAVVVVGDVDPADIASRIEALFGDLADPDDPRARTEYDGPRYDATDVVVASDPEAYYTLVQVTTLLPEAETFTAADYRSRLVAALYNQMLSARFAEHTEDPDAPYSFASAGRGGLIGDRDAYRAFAVAKPGEALEALESVVTENRRVLEFGFTDTEFARAKANVLDAARNAARQAESATSDRYAGALVQAFLSGEPAVDEDTELALTERFLGTVALAEVDALAGAYLGDGTRAVVVTGSSNDSLPTEPELTAALERADAKPIEAYVDDTGEAAIVGELAPVAIVDSVRFDSADVTIVTLANGVRVAYKKTDFKKDQILMSGVSEGGLNQFADAQFPEAGYAGAIGATMGLGPYKPSQLAKALAGKSVSVSAGLSAGTDDLSGSATPATLPDLFGLTYLHFQGGTYDSTLADAFVASQRSFLANLENNPDFKFGNAVSEELYGADDPRHQPPSLDVLDAVDLRAAYDLYRERFANATDWQFNFAGDFDVDTLLAYATRYLGNLPSSAEPDVEVDPEDDPREGEFARRFRAGRAPKANVLLLRSGDFVDSERERVLFAVMREALSEELRDQLREELGGVYGVRVGGGTETDLAPTYTLTVSYDAEPERVDELMRATEEVIARIRDEGLGEGTLPNIRATQYQQAKTAMRNSNGFWLSVMERAYTLGRNVNHADAERLRGILATITEEDVRAAVAKYLDAAADTKLEVVMEPE